MFKTFDADRIFIENKYHKTDEPFNHFSRFVYHGYDYDHSTGLDDDGILAGLKELDAKLGHLPHPVIKAKAIEYVLQNTRIDVNEHDYFIGLYSWAQLPNFITLDKWKREVYNEKIPEVNALMRDFNESGAVSIWQDFDHVVPDWNSIMDLGFKGILERARRYRKKHQENAPLTDRQTAYFDGIEIVYTAIIEFVDRLYRYALTKTHEKAKMYAECLKNLRDGAPTNFYEALQLIYIYFMVSESVDHYQVRSLGSGLDNTLYRFYKADLENGTFTRDEIKELLAYFFMQWQAIGNYYGQPLYLGGTDRDGNCKINELSYDIIDLYDEIGIYNPKIQIKVNRNTPKLFLNKIFDMIRKENKSFVLCCEPGFMRAVMSYGASYEEALDMDIRGCYETGIRANEVSSSTGYINTLKCVLYALNDGFDEHIGRQVGIKTGGVCELKTFDDFYAAFLKQYDYLIEKTIWAANIFENYMEEINPSSMYSATITTSLEQAFDGYQGGVKYSNSAMLNCSLATAVDALMAVYELVYEKNIISLGELKVALQNNWRGYEIIRAKARALKHKYGNGDPLADRYAAAISDFFNSRVNGRKNARGGVYKTDLHSARQFIEQGEKTGATPDGRMAGEEISKNASPTVGMDKSGVTALVKSATGLAPYRCTEGFCLDVMLHPSAVQGEDGLVAMRAILDTYMDNGGMSIQFNVFGADTLRDAQANPEKYKNLQVRVCGWNILWNNMSREEQNAYILRAENIQ